MKLDRYPEYERHKEKHASMTHPVLNSGNNSTRIRYPAQFRSPNFIKDWFGKHIMETDKSYEPYLKKKRWFDVFQKPGK
jgi:hemerythrin